MGKTIHEPINEVNYYSFSKLLRTFGDYAIINNSFISDNYAYLNKKERIIVVGDMAYYRIIFMDRAAA